MPRFANADSAVRAQRLLDDPSTTELVMSGPHKWFVKAAGRLNLVEGNGFDSEEDMVRWINHLLETCGSAERLDGSTYRIEAGYSSHDVHARVHVMAPPVAPEPEVTIAKQQSFRLALPDLVGSGTLSSEMADFLCAGLVGGLRIVVSGAFGAGKTTVANALASLWDPDEMVLVLQEVPELLLPQPAARYLFTRAVRSKNRSVPLEVLAAKLVEYAGSIAGGGAVGLADAGTADFLAFLGARQDDLWAGGFYSPVGLGTLVEEGMRMRPDHLVVGEVRGAEVVELFKAFTSGRSGVTTVHAEGGVETTQKLQMLALEHPSHPSAHYCAQLVSRAVDLVVWMRPPELGQWRVGEILEVVPHAPSEGVISTQPLFRYDPGPGFRRVDQPTRRLRDKLAAGGVVAAL